MTRQPRTERRPGTGVRLSGRDEAVLKALVRFRLARTGSLADLVFPGARRDTAARRLRRLFDAGYLAVDMTDRTEENRYFLGPEGRRWAEAHGLPVRRPPRGDAEHHLAIVDAWSGLAASLKGHRQFSLALARPDWELREEFGDRGVAVVPDLLVELTVRSGVQRSFPVRLAIEVDLGTERLPVLERKIEAYEALRADPGGLFGWRDFGLAVLAVKGTLSHPGSTRGFIEERWGGWWIVCPRELWPLGLLDMLERDPRAPLTTYPYSKGTAEPATDDAPTPTAGEGRGH